MSCWRSIGKRLESWMPGMTKHNHIYPLTRAVAFFIIPFLVAAFIILYILVLYGEGTAQRFAWDIPSRLTTSFMGAGYLGGAYFFLRAGLEREWHRISAGFLPVAAYTLFMLLATFLHWDTFDPNHWPFLVWLALYIITPLLIPLIWWRNHKDDPQTIAVNDRQVPEGVRRGMMIAGAVILLAAVLLFISPTVAIGIWPWELTPLTARVMAGWQALLGVGALTLARDPRWSAWIIPLQSILLWQLLVLLALVLHRNEFGVLGLVNWFVLYTLGGIAALILVTGRVRQQQPQANIKRK